MGAPTTTHTSTLASWRQFLRAKSRRDSVVSVAIFFAALLFMVWWCAFVVRQMSETARNRAITSEASFAANTLGTKYGAGEPPTIRKVIREGPTREYRTSKKFIVSGSKADSPRGKTHGAHARPKRANTGGKAAAEARLLSRQKGQKKVDDPGAIL
mmetsp:Transcript_39087/g.99916  ORF Transcript_39087/g.99916 Transcript_39087/m.99916 type:complete len:156 (+) Transcript_39087:328-795(+)|eukprot:jgi/Tetstr1/429481/TSEL_019388.t1